MASSSAAWSMTGFGQGSASLPSGTGVEVQLRTVNHRHADVRCRIPPELAEHTHWIEERVRRGLRRGRAEATVRLTSSAGGSAQLDVERARAAFVQLRALRDELAPDQPVPLSLLASLPGLFGQAESFEEPGLREALGHAIEEAFLSLDAMRAREGVSLVADLRERLGAVASHVDWIDAHRQDRLDALRERLRGRVEALLEGAPTRLDPGRLEQEIALLAERSDVAEELTRLRSHLAQFGDLLPSPGQQVGRKLDFLLQEMNREVNTIGSKANDAAVAQRVVELKAELERLREQVQNVL